MIDEIVRRACRELGCKEDGDVFTLARCALGLNAIRKGVPPTGSPACRMVVNGRSVIVLSPTLNVIDARFYLAHELGHEFAQRYGLIDDERTADAIGAALVAPRAIVARTVDRVGVRPKVLATAMRVSQTCAVLRVGEVLRHPVAVACPVRVRTRGPARDWPARGVVGARMPPWMRAAIPLSDAKNRVAMLG